MDTRNPVNLLLYGCIYHNQIISAALAIYIMNIKCLLTYKTIQTYLLVSLKSITILLLFNRHTGCVAQVVIVRIHRRKARQWKLPNVCVEHLIISFESFMLLCDLTHQIEGSSCDLCYRQTCFYYLCTNVSNIV